MERKQAGRQERAQIVAEIIGVNTGRAYLRPPQETPSYEIIQKLHERGINAGPGSLWVSLADLLESGQVELAEPKTVEGFEELGPLPHVRPLR